MRILQKIDHAAQWQVLHICPKILDTPLLVIQHLKFTEMYFTSAY